MVAKTVAKRSALSGALRKTCSLARVIKAGMKTRLRSLPAPSGRAELLAQARSALDDMADALERVSQAIDALASSSAEQAPAQAPAPRLLTVPQAAKALSLGTSTVHELLRSGKLASVKIGAARRIPVEAIDAFVSHAEEAS